MIRFYYIEFSFNIFFYQSFHLQVEWGWTEPQAVGETMCFTVHCFQRNGQPYPICDTDELTVAITHGSRKVSGVGFNFWVIHHIFNTILSTLLSSTPTEAIRNINEVTKLQEDNDCPINVKLFPTNSSST